MSQTLIAQISTIANHWYAAGIGLLTVAIVSCLLLWRRMRVRRIVAQAENDSVAIEPVWESNSEISAAQKKQITRAVSSGAFRRMRDSDK
ncbi:MAG: hypothetical protein ACYTDT_01390 [Planctomycetota bacterium]|jgi:hypothetical protein